MWLRRFSQLGYLGLLDRQRSKPSMPNKIRPDVELIIYNYIRDYPTHGPRRISNELKAQGITISETWSAPL
ncbi:MAG: helix-turn-helix domain-containing protein [Candidatus Methanofastidiosa archaeon]|nr:helix-turn-helix domain-containing protein [Candidatus Methanofastidiosa archaeon]